MKYLRSLMAVASLCPVTAIAQEAEPGGVFFTFNINQLFEATTDRDLATTQTEDGFDSVTNLSFGAVTETRTDRLAYGLDTGVRLSDGDFSNDDSTIRLTYRRSSADAILDISARVTRADISFLRDATDFINAAGELILPDDFEDLTGSGVRNDGSLSATLRWGETAPLGYRISLSQSALRYENANATLDDEDTGRVSAGVRLNFNEVTTGNLDLSYIQTDAVGSGPEDFTTLSTGLTFDRPLGELTTRVSATRDIEGDVFWAAAIDRRFELPGRTLNVTFGVVEDEDGEARLTGQIAYSLPRPAGQLGLSAIHSVSAGADRATTTVTAGYRQDLSPVSNMRFGFDFAQASDPDGSDVLATGSLSASYGISLTDVWDLSVGGRVNVRDDDGTQTNSNTVFLALDRPISWRP